MQKQELKKKSRGRKNIKAMEQTLEPELLQDKTLRV
jgi:hypothetical protein